MNNLHDDFGERLEKLGGQAAKPITKILTEVKTDILESVGLKDVKEIGNQEKKQIEKNDQTKIMQNLATINAEMQSIHKQREERSKQVVNQQKQKAQEKKFDQKRKESVLAKLIKSRQGSKESSLTRASG